MTLPSARKITIEGQTYSYCLKRRGSKRMIGDSSSNMRLVIHLGGKSYASLTFRSKHWTEDHDNGEWWAPPHKVAFKPSDVRAVIDALQANEGVLPRDFELAHWVIVA